MHIAFFANTYLPVVNGVVRSMSTFREALMGLGHNVFIFAQHANDYEDEQPFIFRYPAIDLPNQDFPVTIPVSNFVDRLLPTLKLDVIHAHHPVLLGAAAASKAESLNLPLVFTHHTRYKEYSHYVALPQELVKEVIERYVGDYMARCNHIVVPSESIRRMLGEVYGITERITVVPTGIDYERFANADGSRIRQERGWDGKTVLVGVGRMAKEKNWGTVIDAVAQVAKEHPEVRLALVGGGKDQDELEEHAEKAGVGEQVEFVGQVAFNEVPEYLAAANLFCFASVTETQGLVTLEAMAAGLPVVAVDATGTSDVLSNEVEGLLTRNDVKAFAEGLRRMLGDDELRQSAAEAARKKAADFAMKRQAERMLQVYERAIADQRAERLVRVDKQKPIFGLNWRELIGLQAGG